MEIIVVQADAFQQLVVRVDELNSLIKKSLNESQPKQWLDNNEFCKMLSVSRRTAQAYRDRRMVNFVQVGSKILYRASDVETFLLKHHIRSTAV